MTGISGRRPVSGGQRCAFSACGSGSRHGARKRVMLCEIRISFCMLNSMLNRFCAQVG
jgi:hypothetical protein